MFKFHWIANHILPSKCFSLHSFKVAHSFFLEIMDYKKFVYEQKKRDKALKAKSTQVVVKEIRFGPQTDEHDYEFKRKNAEKFLKEGSKVKAYVHFVGRTIVFKERGVKISIC